MCFSFRVPDMLEAKTCQQYLVQIIITFPRLQTSEKQTLPKRFNGSRFYDNQLSTLRVMLKTKLKMARTEHNKRRLHGS